MTGRKNGWPRKPLIMDLMAYAGVHKDAPKKGQLNGRMAKNMKGILLYDDVQDRFCIADNERQIELHCGDVIKVQYNGDMVDMRIEQRSDGAYGWYFYGVGCAAMLIGHTAIV